MAEDHRRVDTQSVQEVLLDDPAFLREIVERVLQEMLEAEMTHHIGAAPYERTERRAGHRNGHKPRALRTRVGTLNLLVPQDREGTFSTRLFARYQRNEKALVLALMEMYIEGVSTRKVTEVTEALCGTSFSKSLVSQLAGHLDAELEAWRNRPLEAESYPYLFVDARYEKVRVGRRVVSQGVLVVSAVRDDGLREILGVEVADTESEATYQELFRSLKRRGLKGVELVVSDEHGVLKAALARHFQGASHQRCQVHYARNLLGTVGAKRRKELAADLRAIFAASATEQALRITSSVAEKWREQGHEKVAEHLEEHVEECFSCLSFPESHPHHQRPGEAQPGDKAPNASGEDLPQPRGVPQAGYGALRRALGRVGNGQALPGHGRAKGKSPRRAPERGGDAHEAMREDSSWRKLQNIWDLTQDLTCYHSSLMRPSL